MVNKIEKSLTSNSFTITSFILIPFFLKASARKILSVAGIFLTIIPEFRSSLFFISILYLEELLG